MLPPIHLPIIPYFSSPHMGPGENRDAPLYPAVPYLTHSSLPVPVSKPSIMFLVLSKLVLNFDIGLITLICNLKQNRAPISEKIFYLTVNVEAATTNELALNDRGTWVTMHA